MTEIIVDPLHLDVRGSEGIDLKEGSMTGNMEEFGISINTVWYADQRKAFGGCIDREETRQLRDFLNKCIKKWECE